MKELNYMNFQKYSKEDFLVQKGVLFLSPKGRNMIDFGFLVGYNNESK